MLCSRLLTRVYQSSLLLTDKLTCDGEAVSPCHKVASGRVAVDEGLAAHADEEEALVARVDHDGEDGEEHERREEDGGGGHQGEVALGAARAGVSETHFVLALSC